MELPDVFPAADDLPEKFSFLQISNIEEKELSTSLAVEFSMTLSVNGEEWLTFQCTPEDMEELAVGFLFNEAVIQNTDEIVTIQSCKSGENIDVWLDHQAEKPNHWIRNSGCIGGYSSKSGIDEPIERIMDGNHLQKTKVFSLISSFLTNQNPHSQTGGVHTSAYADDDRILFFKEDIGRHNTFDKIAGHILLRKVLVSSGTLLTTGRVSSEMIRKAARIRTPYVISMRSPSAASIKLADEWGITLLSHARINTVNVFTHIERICD